MSKNYTLVCQGCGSTSFTKEVSCLLREGKDNNSTNLLSLVETYYFACRTCKKLSDLRYSSISLVGAENHPKGQENYALLSSMVENGSFK